MASSLYETNLQRIIVAVFINLQWIFVLMIAITMIHCRGAL